MLQGVLSGLGGGSSTIALWSDRLRKHFRGYKYWGAIESLKDTLPSTDSPMSISLLVSCAFDFEELINVELKGSKEAMQGVNQSGQSPLHVAIENGSCASVANLLTLDQHYIGVMQEEVIAAARNASNGKEVMTVLLDRRGDDVQITQEVVQRFDKEIITVLLNRRGHDDIS